jgi:CRP-like cAMP-binding protein
VVGFLDAIAPSPAPTGAQAETDVVAFRLETDAIRDVCEQNFAVLSGLLRYVADRTLDDRHALLRSIVGRTTRGLSGDRPLDRVGRIVALHRSPAFPSHSMDALAELAGHLDEVRMAAGGALWRPGDAADGFFLVCSGDIRLGGGPWRVGDQLGPGAVPGIVATLAGRAYEYEAVASEPSLLLRVRAEPFFDVIEDHFEMAFEMLGRMACNLLDVESGSASVGASVSEDGGSGRSTG